MTDEQAIEAVGHAPEPEPQLDSDTTGEPPVWERIDWIAVAALFVCSLILVGLHVRAYTTLSPIDELQHVDFAIKAGNFEPPHVNDLVGFEAMSEAACRGVDAPGYIGPRCGLDTYDPEDFPENGVNTSAGQFPFYYSVTGVVSRAFVATGVLSSPVTAARMVGALWAGAGWSVMWYLLALFRVPRARRVVALAVLIAAPLTLFHAATVNADSILMLTGSLAVLAAIKYDAGRLRAWLLLVVFAALYFVEPTNILPIAASGAFLVVRAWTRADVSRWQRVVPLLIFPMLLVLRLQIARRIQRAWFPASRRTSRPTMFVDNAASDGVVWDKILAQLDAIFTPINRAYVPPFLRSQHTFALQEVADWLLIGAMFAVAAGLVGIRLGGDGERDDRVAWLTRFGMLTMIAAGPFYTFSFAYFSDADFPAPARFGLPLIVFLVIGLASALTTRWAMAMGATVAALASTNLVWLLLTP